MLNLTLCTHIQYEVRKQRSCNSHLAVDDLAKVWDEKGQVGAILQEFSKVFDDALHHHLQLRLEWLNTLTLIKHFLSDRVQWVVYEGKWHQIEEAVRSDIPHDIVLAKTFPFLTYINGLPDTAILNV